MADMVMLPAKPIRAITADITADIHQLTPLKGVAHRAAPPTSITLAVPPKSPSQVRVVLIAGTITCLLGSCDQAYCKASLSCAIRMRRITAAGRRRCLLAAFSGRHTLGVFLLRRGRCVNGDGVSPLLRFCPFFKGEQRRRVTQTVDANQQAALDFRRSLEESLVITGNGDACGDQEEGVDGNQNAVKAVVIVGSARVGGRIVAHSDQPELQRRNEKEETQNKVR